MAVIPDDRAEVIARRFGTPGREFLDELPERLTRIVARWHLTLGRPLPVGIGGYLVNVQTQTGVDAVLKLSPTGGEQDRANELETYALRRWNGNAAVRLFMEDTTAGALLVERCAPGVTIDTLSDDDMLRAGCALARTLHRAPDAEDSRLLSNALHDVAARVQGLDGWMKRMGHPLSVGAESIVKRIHEDMPGAAAPIVVCHGDMNLATCSPRIEPHGSPLTQCRC